MLWNYLIFRLTSLCRPPVYGIGHFVLIPVPGAAFFNCIATCSITSVFEIKAFLDFAHSWPNKIFTDISDVILSSRKPVTTRVSQMKTLNMFYLVIYWTQKVHNEFIFLCSIVLPPVGHSSNHEYHCWNLQDNRAVVRSFIAIFRFSVESPSYLPFYTAQHFTNLESSSAFPWGTQVQLRCSLCNNKLQVHLASQ